MSHHHNHDGHHHVHTSNKKVLAVSLAIISAFMLVEVVGGVLTGSLALLSDAGHMFSDALAIGFSLLAFKLGEKAVSARQTFGYQRLEILFALLNGLTLVGIAVFIIIEAVARFNHPPEIATTGMLVVSSIGLLVNIAVAWYMHRNSDVEENVNMKSAYLHVLGDLLGSVGAIAAALLMMLFGWKLADPMVSVFFSLLIAHSGIGVMKSTFHILMQGAPTDIKQADLVRDIKAVGGMKNVHDLHLWTLTSRQHLLSAHLVVDGHISVNQAQAVIDAVEQVAQRYGIGHSTLQIEGEGHGHSEALYCDANGGAYGHHHHEHDGHTHHGHKH
ncbi:cobalt-zinc-cadmium efflux system protein [Neisseria sp. HSC-16F19]|nr:cation diffusion facilitator family transporter [Neisseria sp. HSC-16F19]MCP2041563.1 cobalt-zinc-cadmium efflux system protein [Neisseria sp. HSC-16F19]